MKKEGGRYSMSEVTGRGINVEKEGGMNVVREIGRRIQVEIRVQGKKDRESRGGRKMRTSQIGQKGVIKKGGKGRQKRERRKEGSTRG